MKIRVDDVFTTNEEENETKRAIIGLINGGS